MHAVVVGSSGYVGSRLIAALTAAGHQVTATARDVRGLDRFDFPAGVSKAELDVNDPDSCLRALTASAPVDVAFYLVHSIGGDDYAARDRTSAENFATAARRTRVRRIVYLGGFVPDGEELSEHLGSRAEVGEALDDTSVELVWLRAAVILGAGSTSYELIRYLAERLPVVPLPRFMRQSVAPIAVDDVLRYLQGAADPVVVPPGHYDISNREQLTYSDLIQQYARDRRLRRWWLPLPFVSARFAAPLVSLLTPIPKELVADLVQSLDNTMSSADDTIRTLIPDPPAGLTTLHAAIDRAAVPVDFTARGVCATADPLMLTATDPMWAGGDHYRRQASPRPAPANEVRT